MTPSFAIDRGEGALRYEKNMSIRESIFLTGNSGLGQGQGRKSLLFIKRERTLRPLPGPAFVTL